MSEVHEMKTLTLAGEEFNSFPDQKAREDILKKLPLPEGSAQVGQYLRVLSVDAEGKITGLEVADVPTGGGSSDSGGNAESGEDGFSPIATVEQTDAGAVISITDANGTTTAIIANGKDGADGAKGDKGDKGDTGAAGKDGTDASVTAANIQTALGYTPVDSGKLSLGIHTDGFAYLFVDGTPVGAGIELTAGGISGYVAEDGTIVLTGLEDGEYTIAYEMEDGTIVTIGKPVVDNNVYYSVTNTLTNCVSSNSATEAIGGESYNATISANSGYELSSVVVTMGGTDITASAVSGGNISIAEVAGNIVITAVAEKVQTGPSYTNQIPISTDASGNLFVGTNGEAGYKTGYRLSMSSGNETAASGYEVTGFIPVKQNDVIRIKNIDVTSENNTNIVFYNSDKTGFASSGNHGIPLNTMFVTGGTESNGVYTRTLNDYLINNTHNIAYMRIGSKSITDESIITVNEEIV